MDTVYWIRRLLVDAFARDAKRKKLARDEVNHHWPYPVPKDCKCTTPGDRDEVTNRENGEKQICICNVEGELDLQPPGSEKPSYLSDAAHGFLEGRNFDTLIVDPHKSLPGGLDDEG